MPIGKSSAGNLPKTTDFDLQDYDRFFRPETAERQQDIFNDILSRLLRKPVPQFDPFVPCEGTRYPELKSLFKFVDSTVDGLTPAFVNFLETAIKTHNIDVSKFEFTANKYMDCSIALYAADSLCPERLVLNLWSHPDGNFADDKFVILHELRHIEQMKRGWLTYDFGERTTIWKGRTVQTNAERDAKSASLDNVYWYNKIPPEMDANIFAINSPLYQPCTIIHAMLVDMSETHLKHTQWVEADGIE